MLNRLRTYFLVAGVVLASATDALAIIGVDVLAGQRRTTFKRDSGKDNVSATEIQIGAHVDPIPLVPVAFGLYYILHDYDVKEDGEVHPMDTFKGSQFGAEAVAWLPLKPTDFSLFAKAGYTFLGTYEGKNSSHPYTAEDGTTVETEIESKFKTTGVRMALGIKWSPIALVSALLQVDYAKESFKYDEAKIAGTKVSTDSSDDVDASSMTVLLGFQVKI